MWKAGKQTGGTAVFSQNRVSCCQHRTEHHVLWTTGQLVHSYALSQKLHKSWNLFMDQSSRPKEKKKGSKISQTVPNCITLGPYLAIRTGWCMESCCNSKMERNTASLMCTSNHRNNRIYKTEGKIQCQKSHLYVSTKASPHWITINIQD